MSECLRIEVVYPSTETAKQVYDDLVPYAESNFIDIDDDGVIRILFVELMPEDIAELLQVLHRKEVKE